MHSLAACDMVPMTKVPTLREANQGFSRCIREVEAGEAFVITRSGTSAARLTPARRRRALTERPRALLRRVEEIAPEGWPIGPVRVALGIASVGRASYCDGLLVATAAEAECRATLSKDMARGNALQDVHIRNAFTGGELAPAAHALFIADEGVQLPGLPNIALNSHSDSRIPFLVRTTDLTLPTGSWINSFL